MTIEYTDEITDIICDLIADGKSVRQICVFYKDDNNFPSRSTILRWLNQYPDFEAKCARARTLQGDENFDRTGEVIDKLENGSMLPEVGRVILSGLQWRASKLNSKKYGEKSSIELGGVDGKAIEIKSKTDAELNRRLIEVALKTGEGGVIIAPGRKKIKADKK